MSDGPKKDREMVGVSICRALGLDAKNIRAIRISVDAPGHFASVTVEREIFDEDAKQLVSVFESLRLVPADTVSGDG